MRKKKTIVWLASLFGLPLLGSICFVLLCFADNHITRRAVYVRSYFWGHHKFDAGAWRRVSGTDGSTTIEQQDRRGKMLFSLLRTHRLTGMTREQVTELLGAPDQAGNGYSIGNQTGIGIDLDVFYLEFDASNRVTGFRVEQE